MRCADVDSLFLFVNPSFRIRHLMIIDIGAFIFGKKIECVVYFLLSNDAMHCNNESF